MSKKTDPAQITMTFDLHDLPTAQHRAGLAGLILQIDSMGEGGNKRSPRLIPRIEQITTSSAIITFTRESMQGVFDDLYEAKLVEVVVAAKWPGKTKPKPGAFTISKRDPKTNQIKEMPGFAYDVVQPQGPCLARHLEEGFQSPWHELWRQMIWSIPRGGNNVRSRAPFIDRANQKPCGDGTTAWNQLVEFEAKKAKALLMTAPISGALMLGVQAVNAENVPFAGRIDHNLLLHFWQLVVLIFTPQSVNKKDAKVERVGYVLAIPDVADLQEFRYSFQEVLQSLRSEPGRGTLAARIVLPEQAGLEVLKRMGVAEGNAVNREGRGHDPQSYVKNRLLYRDRGSYGTSTSAIRDLAAAKAKVQWNSCIRAVESYHMVKLGNNVKLLSFKRLAGRPGLIKEYEKIERDFRNPLFRAALMQALICVEPWHSAMMGLFTQYPSPFFIEGEETPRFLPRFGRDCREKLLAFYKDIHDMSIEELNEDEKVKKLSLVIQKIINRHVEIRAERKTGIKVSNLPKRAVFDKQGQPLKRKDGQDLLLPIYPKAFREAQQRVCSDAFLSMRSRHDQDFVNYFAETILHGPQQLSPASLQFLVGILMTNPDPNPVGRKRLCWEDVKVISMIAVSACSFNVREREAEPQRSNP